MANSLTLPILAIRSLAATGVTSALFGVALGQTVTAEIGAAERGDYRFMHESELRPLDSRGVIEGGYRAVELEPGNPRYEMQLKANLAVDPLAPQGPAKASAAAFPLDDAAWNQATQEAAKAGQYFGNPAAPQIVPPHASATSPGALVENNAKAAGPTPRTAAYPGGGFQPFNGGYTQPVDPNDPAAGEITRPSGVGEAPVKPASPQRPAGWVGGPAADGPAPTLGQPAVSQGSPVYSPAGLLPPSAQLPPAAQPSGATTGAPGFIPASFAPPTSTPPAGGPSPGGPPTAVITTGPAAATDPRLSFPLAPGANPDAGAAQPTVETPPPVEFEAGKMLAKIGAEFIFAGDVHAIINESMALKKVPPEMWEAGRKQNTEEVMRGLIETKMVYADAKRTIPAANFPTVEEKAGEEFDKKIMKKKLAEENLTTAKEFDALLRRRGTSLERVRRGFIEKQIAQMWISSQVNRNIEIPHAKMLEHYQKNIASYQFEGKSKWEEIAIHFDKVRDKAEAYKQISELGNRVLQGASFAEVAKSSSQGPTASSGGLYDWTTRGSLVSKTLDEAIFALPVGRMSQILEDERGFHIVRVVERTEAGQTPFLEAQVEIKKKIKEENYRKQVTDYLVKVREQTPVWTVFDKDKTAPAGAE